MAVQNDNTILNKGDLKAYHERIAPMLGGTFMVSTNNSDYYSTDEKVVGVWTDGKPIYQKTIHTGPFALEASSTVAGRGWQRLTAAPANLENLVLVRFININGSEYKTQQALAFTVGAVDSGYISVVNFRDVNIAADDAILFLQYTKTTDTAGSATTTPGAYDINFPNTWPANKEIYFGNGMYGYRAVDKTTGVVVPAVTSSGVVAETVLTNTAGAKYLVGEGGVVYYNNLNKPYHQAFKYSSYANGEGAWGTCSVITANGITMQFNQEAYYGKTRASFTGYYDVWFKYTK